MDGETDAQGKLKLEPRSTPPTNTMYAHVLLCAYACFFLPEMELDYSVQSDPLITFAVIPEDRRGCHSFDSKRENDRQTEMKVDAKRMMRSQVWLG